MAGNFGNMFQKAIYLGVGIASYASEQAKEKLQEVRVQAQKLADEMVARGEMTMDEARRFVDAQVQQAQQTQQQQAQSERNPQPSQPRQIEIVEEGEESETTQTDEDVDALRQQVEALQEQLRQLNQ